MNRCLKTALVILGLVAMLMPARWSQAGNNPLIGEISMFAGTFAPRSWAFCDGQLLAISQYSALFSILGTMYGGDGRTSFALPDLRGRIAIGTGQGPGLPNRPIGSKGGSEAVALTPAQLPSHSHTIGVFSSNANQSAVAAGLTWAASPRLDRDADFADTSDTTMASAAIQPYGGGGQSHENRMPSLGVNFIIALDGTYPSRN